MAKVLLVIPPCFTDRQLDFEIGFPVNMAILGQSVRAEGWDVEYLDMTLEEKEGYDSFVELDRRLEDGEVNLVGISNHTVRTSVTTRAVAERIRLLRPEVRIVVGGVNATFMTRELLESCSAIDYVLRGYGQPGIRALVRSLQANNSLPIPGLAKMRMADLYEEPLASVLPEDFSTPSLVGLDVSRYTSWTTTYPILTHTGCGFSCNFCTSVMPGPYQSKEVYRPVEDVITEMTSALECGFDRFFVSDNIFTSCKEYCLKLCDAMKSNRIPDRATWVCMTRVEFVDDELFQALREAGCANVAFGVETANVDQWKSLRKGRFSEEVVQTAFRRTRKAGIGTTAYLMLGLPSQTQGDVDTTADLVRELDPDYRVISFFQPFPGTPYWETPEKFGLTDIAPLEDWNFHEGPICSTRHLNKQQLNDAAARLYLERGAASNFCPSVDGLEFVDDIAKIYQDVPTLVYDVVNWTRQRITIRQLLNKVAMGHGTRGRLIALYWLSAAMRDGYARIVNGVGLSNIGGQLNITLDEGVS